MAAGYVGFALDLFGMGNVTTHLKEAQAFVSEAQKAPAVITARFQAALAQLKQDPQVDPEKLAAIGYCFGGSVVLETARSGADLDAVVSFPGALGTKTPAERGKVKANILVLTSAADPFVPAEQVEAFTQEMKATDAEFEVVTFLDAKHGFTDPNAGKAGLDALEYNAEVDNKSWVAMLGFFKEVFY